GRARRPRDLDPVERTRLPRSIIRRWNPRAPMVPLTAAAILVAGCAGGPSREAGPPPELWFYQSVNLADRDVIDRVTPVWVRAARAGYRRVVLADYKFGRLADMAPDYFGHAARLKALADSLGLGIVPGVFSL